MKLAPEELEARLFRVLDVLDEMGVPWFLTGALVRNTYGEWRATRDFDLVLDVRQVPWERVRDTFASRGFVVEGPTHGNLGRRLVVDSGGSPVDLWLAPDTEIHRREFERVRRIPYAGRMLVVMDPEDYVLRKLVNFRRIRAKQSDLDDAYQVLLHAWDQINPERLIARATGHRVEATARELVDLVREDLAALKAGRSPEG